MILTVVNGFIVVIIAVKFAYVKSFLLFEVAVGVLVENVGETLEQSPSLVFLFRNIVTSIVIWIGCLGRPRVDVIRTQ